MEQIGKYRVVRQLGQGGFGTVYLAEDPLLKLLVAIKVFQLKDASVAQQITSASQDASQVLKERFLNEARILRQLSRNPYVIELYEFDALPDGTPYYVMPYLEKSLVDEVGKDALDAQVLAELPQALRPRKLSLNRTLQVIDQLLQALADVHAAGLVHRDIKPANVLLHQDGDIRLTDFGVAKLPDAEHSQTGLALGSRNYMSPEQRESAKHVDARSDIYSVGVLMYRLISGTLPVGRFADALHYEPALGEALNRWILACLETDKNKRFPDATAALTAYRQAKTGAGEANSEQTGTFVGGTGSTLKSELKPLQLKITELFKTEGMVDNTQRKALSVAAEIAGVSEADLNQLIEETKTSQPQAVQSFIKWREKAEAVRAQHKGNIPTEERQALLDGGVLLGKTEAELARFLPVAKTAQTKTAQASISQHAADTAPVENKKSGKGLLVAGIATALIAGGGYYLFSQNQQTEAERTQDLTAWQQAKLADTPEAYQQYLNQVPKGQYRQSAAKALEDLQALAATKQKQAQNQIGQAQQWLIKLGYELTQSGELDARTKAAIEKFETSEKMLVTGSVDETLLTKLEQVYWRNDQQAFEKAKTAHTEQSYQQYLDARADGKYRSEATDGIALVKQQLKDKAIADAKAKADAEEKARQQALAEQKAKADAAARLAAEKQAAQQSALAVKPYVGTMVYIPAGSYMMGCSEGDAECSDAEKPRHQVSIKAFKLMETEVTFTMWDACVQAGDCSHDPDDRAFDSSGRGDKPVINVSFDDITQQFIPWLNRTTGQTFRLPSEAEWEYAARGGTTTKYSWGNSIACHQARYGRHKDGECSNSNDGTVSVKSFAANGYGLYDMHGNVWEWIQDCWNWSYNGAPIDGSAWRSGDCAQRVLRGGSWGVRPADLRVSFRGRLETSHQLIIGFRLAQDL